LAGYDDAEGVRAFVHRLMALAGAYFDSFSFIKDEVVIFDFDAEFAFEDVEELARVDVAVAGFAGGGGHSFFYDAQVWGFHEVPAVAIGSPFIVFGGCDADYFCRHV
jgi:hypothetical protein